jgi:hypothetical protein
MHRSKHCRIRCRVGYTHLEHKTTLLTVLSAMQAEHTVFEEKNHELSDAFKQKAYALQHTTKLYQALKAQVMASHVATAAGDEAELTLQTARGDRFIDRLPGTRVGSAAYNQMGASQRTGSGIAHHRDDSRSSGSSGQQRGGIGLGHRYAPQLQGRGLGGRGGTGRRSAAEHYERLLTSPRICSNRHTISNATKPTPCPRRHASERFPSPRDCSSISSFTNE